MKLYFLIDIKRGIERQRKRGREREKQRETKREKERKREERNPLIIFPNSHNSWG